MKKFRKAIVALLAMVMVIGCLTMQASAADTTTITAIIDDASKDKVTAVKLDVGSSGLTTTAATDTTTWGGSTLYEFTQSSSNSRVWTIEVSGDAPTSQIQIVAINDGNQWGGKCASVDSAIWSNGNVYFSIDVTTSSWGDITPSAADPFAVTADECEEVIAAIGTVTLSKESYDKIQAAKSKVSGYTGETSNISNYAVLTAAEEAFDDLVADAAGTIKIHVKVPDTWSQVNVHTFADGGASGTVATEPGWPGTKIDADANNEGWYTISLTSNGATNMLFTDNGSSDDRKSDNITYVAAGEYWYTVADNKAVTVVTTAPAGWSTGTGSDSNTGTGTDSDSNTGSGTGSDSNTGSGTGSDSNTGSGTGSDSNTGSGTGSDSNAGSGSGNKTDSDTGVSNKVVIVSAVVMLVAATVIVASKKKVTE